MDLTDPIVARRLLAFGRATIGVGAIVAPRLMSTVFGVDPAENPAAPFLMRVFGARELYMASPFLMTSPDLDEGELAARAAPVDAADAVAALAAGLRGYLPWRAAFPAATIGAGAAWLGTKAGQPAR